MLVKLLVHMCVTQELAKSLGRASPPSLDDAIAWAHDNFVINTCHVRRQKTGNLPFLDLSVTDCLMLYLQCFDAVGWVAGRASGL